MLAMHARISYVQSANLKRGRATQGLRACMGMYVRTRVLIMPRMLGGLEVGWGRGAGLKSARK